MLLVIEKRSLSSYILNIAAVYYFDVVRALLAVLDRFLLIYRCFRINHLSFCAKARFIILPTQAAISKLCPTQFPLVKQNISIRLSR